MKKILIVGAGFLQTFVIKKAKEMGYYTIAIDKNPNAQGFDFTDEYSVVDIIDPESCLECAKSRGIDGVITAATDYGVLSVAYIAQQLGLPGLSYEIASVIKNKYIVRRTLFETMSGSISQYFEVGKIDELWKIKDIIKYPIMVKPCDGSGSKAIKRVDNSEGLIDACTEALNNSMMGKVLLEDFITGQEYGVESFVYNGEVYVLGVMGKYMTSPPDYAELGHSIPSPLSIENKVKNIVHKAIKVLGINFGAVNMDVLVTKDGRVCIVDIGARMGGNLIGSHVIPIGTGIDYIENIIKAAVGDPVDMNPKKLGACVATRLLALQAGKVIALPDFESIERQFQVNIYHNLKIGDTIREYHNNLDGCGYVVAVTENDVSDAHKRVEMAKHFIDLNIVRK